MSNIARTVIPLHSASRNKSVVDIKRLLETDDVNVKDQDGKTPLMSLFDFRITKKNVQDTKTIIEIFISKGADVNCRDRYNNTVLHQIANLLHRVTDDKKIVMPIIEQLIKHGADPSTENIYGKTCYRIAYELGARKVGDFLRCAELC